MLVMDTMKRILPYVRLMRLDKPIGIWLLFFPAAWAVLLSPMPLRWDLVALMLLGAVLIRSAGCILNDLADRKLDRQVERTKDRPLANGAISPFDAALLLVVLLLDGLLIALTLPPLTIKLALLAVPLIALYPWMKRLTWWPQAFLGFTFNLGALIGWAATGAALTLPAYLLYAACFFWTLGYDTLYAVQDMDDDKRVGIRSTARRVGLGRRLGLFTFLCYALMLGLFLCVMIRTGHTSAPSLVAWVAACGFAAWQATMASGLGPSDPRGGLLFRSNQYLGLILLAGLAIPYMA